MTATIMKSIDPQDAIFHPVADIFPAMSDAEFRELTEDIRAHGQREAVWMLPDGRVIDGRHRVKACAELGRSVDARVYHGDGDAVTAFVVSLNLKRRHLNESQRAMVGARLANLKRGDNQFTKEHPSIEGTSQSDAAKQMQVGVASIERAAAVQRTGTPELQQSVDAGQVSVSAAAEVAMLPEEEQREVVARGPDAVRETARDIREKKKPHVANNSGEMEWYTPPEYLELARRVLGEIDCDPASSDVANETVRAKAYFTKTDNGLIQEWRGNIWLNPPYAQPAIAEFAEVVALKYEAREFDQACVLVNNATETNWFQRMLSLCDAVCFLKGRVRFLTSDGSPGAPLQGQAVLYFGPNREAFIDAFKGAGIVLHG